MTAVKITTGRGDNPRRLTICCVCARERKRARSGRRGGGRLDRVAELALERFDDARLRRLLRRTEASEGGQHQERGGGRGEGKGDWGEAVEEGVARAGGMPCSDNGVV